MVRREQQPATGAMRRDAFALQAGRQAGRTGTSRSPVRLSVLMNRTIDRLSLQWRDASR